MSEHETRIESDSMGEVRVPASAYYGASTMRAVLNFPISDLRLPRSFIKALGLIKQAAARTNLELGLLDERRGLAIEAAAARIAAGELFDQFVVDVFQSGSGTSTNMNANEVIARLAAADAALAVHPNDHVNLCQSSNDVIPAAMRIAALQALEGDLLPALARLAAALDAKADAFWPVIKTGRTHLQDATPIRLGQEFRGYAAQVRRASERLRTVGGELQELPLGGTAVGTGVNSHPEFGRRVAAHLASLTGLPLREASEHFAAQNNIDAIVALSGELRTLAVALTKIANDVRWMGSGPVAGLAELQLPEVQPGSSIMPGKVNPVIAESLLQVCAQVIGYDAAITVAGQASHFELNMMLPLAAYDVLQSLQILTSGCENFRERCIEGLQATSRGPQLVSSGLMLATALVPYIGYDAAAAIAKEAAASGESILEVALRRTTLTREELERILDPATMLQPGLAGGQSS